MVTPFAMSRWWDILIGQIWLVAIIYVVTRIWDFLGDTDVSNLASGLFALSGAILIGALGAGLVGALATVLIFGVHFFYTTSQRTIMEVKKYEQC